MPRLVRTFAAVPVLQLQRQPSAAFFSIEGYFDRVRTALYRRVTLSVFLLPRISRGLWPRLLNLWAAWQQRAVLCHVTGDVHDVCLVLNRSRCLLTVLDCQILHRLQGWRRAVLKLLWYTLPGRNAARITVISAETNRQLLRKVQYQPERIYVIPV